MTTSAHTAQAVERLRQADRVLLIDFHEDVPRALLNAGIDVRSWYQDFSTGFLSDAAPDSLPEGATGPGNLPGGGAAWPPRYAGEQWLVFVPSDAPSSVDVVCTFRPAEEHEGYFDQFVLPLDAGIFWIERGDERVVGEHTGDILEGTTDRVRQRAEQRGVVVVEGQSIASALQAWER